MNRDDLNQTGIDQTALYIVIVLASVFYDDIQIQLFQSMIFFQVWTNLLEVKRDNTLILFFKMTTAYLYDVSSLSRLFRSK
jgi:ABC-type microcin C transport system permease subunit YejE